MRSRLVWWALGLAVLARLDSITGFVAIAVLLVVVNWFVHTVYWSQWIGRHHRSYVLAEHLKVRRPARAGAAPARRPDAPPVRA
jgi:hypothetical protein